MGLPSNVRQLWSALEFGIGPVRKKKITQRLDVRKQRFVVFEFDVRSPRVCWFELRSVSPISKTTDPERLVRSPK